MDEENAKPIGSEELLRLIPSGVGIYDVTGAQVRMVYLNDGYYQMIGIPRAARRQYEGANTLGAFHPDDLPGLLAEAAVSISEKRMFQYKYRVLVGEGVYRWLYIRANHVALDARTERFFASYYDIDEMARAQQALREKEILFSEMLKYSGTTHFIYYPARHRYEAIALPEQYRRLPAAMDDFPESFIRYVEMQDEDAARYRAMIRAIDGGAAEAECTVRVKFLGQYSWLRVRCQSIFDADGSVARAVGSSVPADSFKAAEQRLREERQQMKSLQSGLLSVVSVNVTRDCRFGAGRAPAAPDWRADPLYAELLRCEPAAAEQNPETLGILLSAAKSIPNPAQRERMLRACSHAGLMRLHASGRRETVLEYRRETPQGLRWVSTRISLTQDPDSGDILAAFVTSDVNERVIYRTISEKIIGRDFEAVMYCEIGTGRLSVKNDDVSGGQYFTSLPYADMVARLLKRVRPEDAARVAEGLRIEKITAELAVKDVCSLYFTATDRDETLPGRPCKRIKCDLFYLDERRDLFALLLSNVTAIYEQEQAQMQKLREALHAAEAASAAKSEFLSRMSHDMRTPLNGIIGMTYLTQEMDLPAAARENLAKIDTSSKFLLALINDVLDMAKAESGKIELHPEPYPPGEFADYIRAVVEPLCREKHQTFVFEPVEMREGLVPLQDKLRINQIVFNLLSNAVKYTPEGGTIRYTAREHLTGPRRMVLHIEVADNGIGMSEAFQKVLFTPFTQEGRDDNSEQRGSGLGLAITKRLVALMNGTISVESAPGRGTTFFLQLEGDCVPADGEAPDAQAAAPARGGLAGLRVLLCEDHPLNQEIAETLLAERGVRTAIAEDGQKGAAMFADSAVGFYDAVLMDIRMPVMDGYQATAAIRALDRPDAATVPIIAMTADAFEDDVRRCLAAGMNGHLAKPIDPQRLYAVLAEACGTAAR